MPLVGSTIASSAFVTKLIMSTVPGFTGTGTCARIGKNILLAVIAYGFRRSHRWYVLRLHTIEDPMVPFMDFEVQGTEKHNGCCQRQEQFQDHWLYPAIVAADPPHWVASPAV